MMAAWHSIAERVRGHHQSQDDGQKFFWAGRRKPGFQKPARRMQL